MIGELWWNRLVNSVRFLDDIQIAVMNEKSVVLFFDDEIPWQDILPVGRILQKRGEECLLANHARQ